MTKQEYDAAYRDARETLYRRGKRVGCPSHRADGLRQCPVDGTWLVDRTLLALAWGEALADEIVREWVGPNILPPGCTECETRWRQYDSANEHLLKLMKEESLKAP